MLRAERFKKGSIAFDRVEVKFNLDETGKPLGVFFKESKDANKLIEEQCKHSSQMEISATEAERTSIKYKQVEFL